MLFHSSTNFGLCSSFSSFFTYTFRLFEIFLVSWCRPLLLWTSLLELLLLSPVDFGKLCFDFHLSQGICKMFSLMSFIGPLTDLVACCLFSMCYIFPGFFLQLIFSFILLCSLNMFGMIWMFLNLLRLVLWPKMWFILENVPCALGKNVYPDAFGYNVLYVCIYIYIYIYIYIHTYTHIHTYVCVYAYIYIYIYRERERERERESIWSNMSFIFSVSLLIFCQDDLFIDTFGVLSLTIIILLYISPHISINIFSIHLDVPTLDAKIFTNAISSCWIDLFIIM